MGFGSFDMVEDGEHNDAGLVEISGIFAMLDDLRLWYRAI